MKVLKNGYGAGYANGHGNNLEYGSGGGVSDYCCKGDGYIKDGNSYCGCDCSLNKVSNYSYGSADGNCDSNDKCYSNNNCMSILYEYDCCGKGHGNLIDGIGNEFFTGKG